MSNRGPGGKERRFRSLEELEIWQEAQARRQVSQMREAELKELEESGGLSAEGVRAIREGAEQ